MNFEEFKKRFNNIIESPDDLESAKSFLESVESDYTAKTTAEQTVKEQSDKIRELQDTNMRLYLAQTAPVEEEEEEEEKEKSFEELLFEADEEEEESNG